MDVAIVGTYPPRACGIATFTWDVEHALRLDERVDNVSVIAIGGEEHPTRESGAVVAVIDPADPATNRAAAQRAGSADVVLLQHEFGIFGGQDGAHVLEFVRALQVPLVVTMHTVLPRFSAAQAAVVAELCERAQAVLVFTSSARRLLLDQRLVKPADVRIVPHGAPSELYQPVDPCAARERFGWNGRRVVSTFGLLSPGKGIECALEAVALTAGEIPDLLYVIAGRTHPGVVRESGERYRESLRELVDAYGLHGHVAFVDRFMAIDELRDLLAASHAFCTPYLGEDQIVSGALTFAVAAGCPIVSTPFRYAMDLLADGAGLIVPFRDPMAMATALRELLTDEDVHAATRRAAQRVARDMSWPAVGSQTAAVLADAITGSLRPVLLPMPAIPAYISCDHLRVLVDDVGILQHADGCVPSLEHGYCVDDIARLVPIAEQLSEDDPAWVVTVHRAVAYLRTAAIDGHGSMRNFAAWDRRWLDEPHDGDHVGRAIWGLGELVGSAGPCADVAARLVGQLTCGFFDAPGWVKNDAYAVLGLAACGAGRTPEASNTLAQLVDRLLVRWRVASADGRWQWFEDRLTYDNARVPEALLRAGMELGHREALAVGVESLEWLDSVCLTSRGYYRFPGHLGLARGERVDDSGHEQPLEASAMLEAHRAAYVVTGERPHLEAADRAAAWFLGYNRLSVALGNLATGGCRDGLTDDGVNQNQGAESTLAFQRAVLARRRLWTRDVHPAGRGAPLEILVSV